MKKNLHAIINGKVSKTIFLIVIASIIFQMILISITITNNNLGVGQIKNYQKTQQGNIALLSIMTSAWENLPENLFYQYIEELNQSSLDLSNGSVTVNFSKEPLCKHSFETIIETLQYHLSNNTKENLNGYCYSSNLHNGDWFNYRFIPNLGTYQTIILLNLMTFLFLIIVGIYISLNLSIFLPLKLFQQSAFEIGMQIKKIPMKESGIGVIRNTSNTLNFMQTKLFAAIEMKTRVLAMVSHDLRTPLVRLKVRMQLENKIQQDNLEDISELELMIDDILIYAKEGELTKELSKKTDLYSLMETIVDEYQDMGKQIELNNSEESIISNARKLSLKRAFTNIINNGLKYGSKMTIQMQQDSKWVYINFFDNGIGVPESDLAHLMDPFYKAKNAAYGTGLGLTIVHEIVKLHQGHVTLGNHINGGLQVEIKLPRS